MFELKQETPQGTVHIKLPNNLTAQQMLEVVGMASGIVRKFENVSVDGAKPTTGTGLENMSFIGQSKLGEHPTLTINFGTYKEPSDGVSIQLLSFPEAPHKLDSIKFLHKETGISIIGCKDIMYGNFKCPKLLRPVAERIMSQFREWNIYAKIVEG